MRQRLAQRGEDRFGKRQQGRARHADVVAEQIERRALIDEVPRGLPFEGVGRADVERIVDVAVGRSRRRGLRGREMAGVEGIPGLTFRAQIEGASLGADLLQGVGALPGFGPGAERRLRD